MPSNEQKRSPADSLMEIFKAPGWIEQDINKSKEIVVGMAEVLRDEWNRLRSRELAIEESPRVRLSIDSSTFKLDVCIKYVSSLSLDSHQIVEAVVSTSAAGALSNDVARGHSAVLRPYEPKARSRTSSHQTPDSTIAPLARGPSAHRASTRVRRRSGVRRLPTMDSEEEDSPAVIIRKTPKTARLHDLDDVDDDWTSREVLVKNSKPDISLPMESGLLNSCQTASRDRSPYRTR